MHSFCGRSFPTLRKSHRGIYLVLLLLCLVVTMSSAVAQSTYGAFVGTVKDPQGAIIVGATVKLVNADTAAVRTEISNAQGQYSFPNIEPGIYRIAVEFSGFRKTEFPGLVLQARETQRVDASLALGQTSQTIEVQTSAGVVNTDTSNLIETRTGIELNNLPVAISSRANGSTSPYSTLQTQAGVQSDESGNISVAGQKPSLLSVTVDGISTMNVTASAPAAEMFPSFNTIEEIRISQNANAAEFGGIADVTTVTKGGTNRSHGGIFDNYETKGFNAKIPTASSKQNLVLNNFGVFYSGPVVLPWLYNGRDKTFYLLSYEGLRLPKTTTSIQTVPTQAMRAGDLSNYPTQIYRPDGSPIVGNKLLSSDLNATSQVALARYYPLPNVASATAIPGNNYVANYATPITSDQGDARIDQTITSKQSTFARYSYKQRSASTALGLLTGIQGAPEKDTSLTGAYNYIFTPRLFNEFRAGLSKYITASTFNSNSSVISQLGIQGIPDLLSPSVAALPRFTITGFTTVSGSSSKRSSNTYQFIDNVTWTKGRHTFKTGADFRRLYAYAGNVFGSSRLGQYTFNGKNAPGAVIKQPFASFLQGVPDTTTVSDVLNADMNGRGNAYAVYVQDDWKVSNTLTLNFGLRYEYHPMLKDKYQNSANFLPDYTSTVNGTTVHGAIDVPGAYALANNVLPAFLSQISPTPLLTAAQAGEPDSLVSVARDDFAPRFGFAWRPLHTDKTVIRGGAGRFIAAALGASVVGGWAVSASVVDVYTNTFTSPTSGVPQLKFPTPFATAPGALPALDFDYAISPHYRDPTVDQWNLTMEQDLGFQTGLRVSYSGSHGNNLTEQANLNQVPYGTTKPTQAAFPYPALGEIQDNLNLAVSNYNALTVEANHRTTHGLQFSASYVFARNLSDEGGINPTSEVGESGSLPSDLYHPMVDYGNVEFTHRQRLLASYVYDLPFGHNRTYLGTTNFFVDRLVSNWQWSGFYLHQTGPFMTPITSGSDPTGSGLISLGYSSYTRPDRVVGVSPYLTGTGARNTLNPAAFVSAPANVGRQGTAAVGSVVGPGTDTFSTSILKGVSFTERVRLDMGVQVQNLFNHQNYETPALDINVPTTYGISTAVQGQTAGQQANAGPRTMLLTARLAF